MNKKNVSENWIEALGLISLISIEIVVTTSIGGGVGLFLNRKYHFPQMSVLVGAFLGFTLGLIWVMRLLKQYERRTKLKSEHKIKNG